jgi:cell division protein FtsL
VAVPVRRMETQQLAAVREGARQEAAARRETRIVVEAERNRPRLEVVPRARRRVGLAGVGFTTLFLVMLGLTVFQTQLARQQLEIDRIEQSVETARLRMTQLQKESAGLHSPERITAEAWKVGLVRGKEDEFMVISPTAIDAVARAAGTLLLDDDAESIDDPLAEHKKVKAIVTGATP